MGMGMTPLILDMGGLEVALPESRNGGYRAELTPLSVDVEMISGRLTREKRGSVWMIEYKYDYFKEEMKRQVIAACRKGQGQPIPCAFLEPDGGTAMRQGRFWVTGFQHPKFMWGKPGKNGISTPLWGGFKVTLREVKPSAGAQ